MTTPSSIESVGADGQTSRYSWFVLAMLTVVYTFNFIDRQILVILQEPIKAELGLSDSQLGLLTGFSFAVVYVTAGIPIAWLADRSNRKNIVAASLAIWSGMTALSGFVQNFTQLLLARLGVGLGEAGGSPPAHSIISDYFPPERRGTALSIYTAGIYVGILLGYAGGGWIAQHLGWREAFFIIGIPGVLFAVLVALSIREPIRGRWERVAPKASTLKDTLNALRQRPSFWWISLGCALTSFVSYGNGNFFPSYLIRSHDMSIAEVGAVLGLISGGGGIIGTFLGGYLSDVFGAKDRRWYLWIPMIGGVLSLAPALYSLLGEDRFWIVVSLFPTNVLSTMYLGACIATCQSLVAPSMRAMASAVLFFVLNMIGLGLGPLMVGVLSDLYQPIFGDDNLRIAMLTTLTVGMGGLFCFWKAVQHLLNDLAKPQ